MNVDTSIIHNSPEVEATQMSINWYMDKQSVLHANKQILLDYRYTYYSVNDFENFMLRNRLQTHETTLYL